MESKNLIKLVRTPPILDFLLQPNDILQVVAHSSQMIYTRMVGDANEDEKENEGGVVVSRIIINLLPHATNLLYLYFFTGRQERKGQEGQGRS